VEDMMLKLITTTIVFTILLFANAALYAGGGGGGGMASDFTKLQLTVLEGSISPKEDLSSLDPGLYEFVVTNKSSNKVVFEIQDLKTEKVLGKIKVKPNKVRKSRVKITENGFRYRNSNEAWYEFTVN